MAYARCQRIIAYTADGSNIIEAFTSLHFNVPAKVTDKYNPAALFSIQFNAQGRKYFHQHALIVLTDFTMMWAPQAYDVLAKLTDLPSTIVPPLYINSFLLEKKFDPSSFIFITEMGIDNVDGLPTYKMKISDVSVYPNKILAKKTWTLPVVYGNYDLADEILNFNVQLSACDPGHSAWFNEPFGATFKLSIPQGGMKCLQVGAPNEPASYTLPNGEVRSGFVTFEGSNLYQLADAIDDKTVDGTIGIGSFAVP